MGNSVPRAGIEPTSLTFQVSVLIIASRRLPRCTHGLCEGESPSLHFLLTQEIFNPPHHIGMVWEELAFDDAVRYTQHGK